MENFAPRQKEMSLKELIQVFTGGKILIAVITIAALIIGALYFFVISTPSYVSSATFLVRIKETVDTPYGEYEIPFNGMTEYINLFSSSETLQRTLSQMGPDITQSQLKNSINVRNPHDTNVLILTATASSPENAYRIAYNHGQSFLRQLYCTLGGMAIDEFSNSLSTQIIKQTKEMEILGIDISYALQLLENTEKTIFLESALTSPEQYALIHTAEGSLDWEKIRGQKILIQALNPSYQIVLERITALEIQRSILERSIEQATKHLEELKTEMDYLTQTNYYADGNFINALNSLVTIISHPSNAIRVGHSIGTVLAISFILGLMLGALVVLFKAYWENAF